MYLDWRQIKYDRTFIHALCQFFNLISKDIFAANESINAAIAKYKTNKTLFLFSNLVQNVRSAYKSIIISLQCITYVYYWWTITIQN